MIRICLMPYWESDEPFAVGDANGSSPFLATTLDKIKLQIAEKVAPGKLELLDALSLSYRGRYEDAVRSAVTAIEVSLESRLHQLMASKGISPDDIKRSLDESRNSFFDRLSQFERLSQKRIPGPMLSLIPYINGLRLRRELENVRTLRHKIVHEGIRIDVLSRGPMLKAIETMTWLFQWMNNDDPHGPENSQNYAFFSTLRGNRKYPFEYTATGVVVRPLFDFENDTSIKTTDEVLEEQYTDSIDVEKADIELFVRMSFLKLGMSCEDGPPVDQENGLMTPRFLAEQGELRFMTFCLEVDGLLDIATANLVIASAIAFQRSQNTRFRPLIILQHQKCLAPSLREIACVMELQVESVLEACGIACITTVDLLFLIKGQNDFKWDLELIRMQLFAPGRHGGIPPNYKRVGTVTKVYPKRAAMSIRLDDGGIVTTSSQIGMRLKTGWYEQTCESLQVNKVAVKQANGPCQVGVATNVKNADVYEGCEVFVRDSKANRVEPSEAVESYSHNL